MLSFVVQPQPVGECHLMGVKRCWPAAKAREVAGLHEALGLEWPPKDPEAVEQA